MVTVKKNKKSAIVFVSAGFSYPWIVPQHVVKNLARLNLVDGVTIKHDGIEAFRMLCRKGWVQGPYIRDKDTTAASRFAQRVLDHLDVSWR
jgi:hypothetical protein